VPAAYVSQADTAMYWERVPVDPTIPLMVGTPFSISAGPNDYISGYFVLNAGDQPLAAGLLDATTLTVSLVTPSLTSLLPPALPPFAGALGGATGGE
jgi:hypothetical protein